MTDRELMQMALYYMDDGCGAYSDDYRKLIEALRARLSQCERCGEVNPAEIHTCTPKQEPVAWMYQHEDTGLTMCVIVQQVGAGFEKNNPRWKKITPLYTAPPQREWQGLTDEEILEEYRQSYGDDGNLTDVYFARAIEAKLKEKNA